MNKYAVSVIYILLRFFKKVKALFAIIAFLSIAHNSNADVGSCAIYKCTIATEYNDDISGYFQISSFDKLPSESKELLDFLKTHFIDWNHSKINVYSKIQTVEYLRYQWSDNIKYTAVADEDTKQVDVKEIQSISIIEITSCECLKVDQENDFEYSQTEFSINYYHHFINDLNQQEIDLLNSKEPKFEYYVQKDKTDTNAIIALNYNWNLDEASFKNLIEKLKFEKNSNQTWDEYNKLRKEHYKMVHDSLRKEGVILIRIASYT